MLNDAPVDALSAALGNGQEPLKEDESIVELDTKDADKDQGLAANVSPITSIYHSKLCLSRSIQTHDFLQRNFLIQRMTWS
jgi:hypothetical protein